MKRTVLTCFFLLILLLPLAPVQSFQGTGLEGTLVYSIAGNEGFELWALDLATQESRFLADGFYPHVSPDGTKVAYSNEESPTQTAIYVISIEGGEPTRITDADFKIPLANPYEWSPDGAYLLFGEYVAKEDGSADASLFTARTDGAEVHHLPFAYTPALLGATWTTDNRILINFEDGLTVLNPDGSKAEVILEPLTTNGIFALHPDGSTVALVDATAAQTINLINLDDGEAHILTDIPNSSGISQMDFSPSGDFIFILMNDGQGYLFNITTLEWQWVWANLTSFDWSPDGQYVLFTKTIQEKNQVVAKPVERSQAEIQLTVEQGSQGNW